MDLNELQSVRDRERQTDKLQQLRESFYADAGEFIRQLHAERDRAADRVEDPFDSPEVQQLTDEINTAEQTVEAIYEKRVGKIVKAASFAAADLPAEADGMTVEEQELFDELVGDIKANREHVLEILDGGDPTPSSRTATGGETDGADEPSPGRETPPQGTGSDMATADDGVSAADVMGGDGPPAGSADAGGDRSRGPDSPPTDGTGDPHPSGPSEESEPPEAVGLQDDRRGERSPDASADGTVTRPVRKDGGPEATAGRRSSGGAAPDSPDADRPAHSASEPDSRALDRQTVHVLDDVDTFVGYDERDYDLERNDVVTLPATNADILVERGVAREIE